MTGKPHIDNRSSSENFVIHHKRWVWLERSRSAEFENDEDDLKTRQRWPKNSQERYGFARATCKPRGSSSGVNTSGARLLVASLPLGPTCAQRPDMGDEGSRLAVGGEERGDEERERGFKDQWDFSPLFSDWPAFKILKK